jgi:hypothetical protein
LDQLDKPMYRTDWPVMLVYGVHTWVVVVLGVVLLLVPQHLHSSK